MIEYIALIFIFLTPNLVVFIRNLLWDVYFWQLKEFRIDRYWVHIRWDYEGSNRNEWLTAIKIISVSLVSFIYISPLITMVGVLLVWAVWVFESIDLIRDLISKYPTRPSFKNPRNILIIVMSVFLFILIHVIIATPFAFLDRANVFGMQSENVLSNVSSQTIIPDIYYVMGLLAFTSLVFDLGSPIISGIFVVTTAPISRFRRWLYVQKGKKKYEEIISKIDYIGITGSQGKSSTKEITYNLLKNFKKTYKTPENYNTEFGVAHTIQAIAKDTEIFIAEIGAYKKGEIKKIVSNFPPDISVITDISSQHIGLFGGTKEILSAKSEIIAEKKADGVVITNGDNPSCIGLKELAKNKFILVTTLERKFNEYKEKKEEKTTVYYAREVGTTKKFIKYNCICANSDIEISFKIPMQSRHLIYSYMYSIAIAIEVGMGVDLIEENINSNDIGFDRMSIETGDSGIVIIDNSFTSNEKSFIEGVTKLRDLYNGHLELEGTEVTKKSRKILVTKGIYELGKYKQEIYLNFIDLIVGTVDIVVTSDPLLRSMIQERSKDIEIVKAFKTVDFIYKTRQVVKSGDLVLVEGKFHPDVLKDLVSDKF